MTVYVQLDCPHPECLTEKARFIGNAYTTIKGNNQDCIVFLQCGVCNNGMIARVRGPAIPHWVNGNPSNVTIVETWPKRPPIDIPEFLPGNVVNFYKQGMDSLTRKNFDAAGTMFRKSLDAGLRRIDPDGKGTLEKRINALPSETGITPPMKGWAHEIRHLGNDAAHEDEPFTDGEAKSLQSFTELFLTYAFTLPGMLAARHPTEGTDGEGAA